jgi:ParB family chromosome partitioning protein
MEVINNKDTQMVATSILPCPITNYEATYDTVDPNILTPHPLNLFIYGENEDISDLVELIRLSGWVSTLVVTRDKLIISDHRHWKASLELGLTAVPIQVVEFDNEITELEALLLANKNRSKTVEQMVREGWCWEDIEKDKAKQRMKNPKAFAHKGKTRDIIAKRVGLGSGRNYDKGTKAVKFMDSLTESDPLTAQAFRKILNQQSIEGAVGLIKLPPPERQQILSKIATGEANNLKAAKKRVQNEKTSEPSNKENCVSCWNCKYRGEDLDEQQFQCYKYGAIDWIIKDVAAIATECGDWTERADSLTPDYSNPKFKTCTWNLSLPLEWLEALEEKAAAEGISAEEWLKFQIGAVLFPPSKSGNIETTIALR